MDTAIIGFLGVIAGAATTGGVQSILAYTGRRNDSLASARLVYGSLVEVGKALELFDQWGHIPASTSFKRQTTIWDAQKETLARVLDVVDYQLIQGAFSNIGYMDDALQDARQAQDHDGGLARLRSDPGHSARVHRLQEATGVAFKKSMRIVEHLKRCRGRHRERLAELPGSEALSRSTKN
jgi:hypothetical protein